MATRAKLRDELPNNIEAEISVLGSMIIDPDVILPMLDPEDFYRDAHRIIYEVMLILKERQEPTDFITICDLLEQQKKLEAIGGDDYITSLINAVPTSANVEHYANIVKRCSLLRKVINGVGNIAAAAYAEDDIKDIQTQLVDITYTLSTGQDKNDLQVIDNVLFKFMQTLEKRARKDAQALGISTGFTDLDNLLGGLHKSDLVIVAARPAVGKTSFALSMAKEIVMKGAGVAFFSLEMSEEQLVQRLISMDAEIEQQYLKSGELDDEHWVKISEAMAHFSGKQLFLDGTAGLAPRDILYKVKKAINEGHQIDVIIVDYLQLMRPDGKPTGNRVTDVADISRNLKLLAKELDLPVVALAQLSRNVESRSDKHPQLSDLRESGSIENDADIVMFIYRDEVYNPETERKGIADIDVAKHRNGPVGNVVLTYMGKYTQFKDYNAYVGQEPAPYYTAINDDPDISNVLTIGEYRRSDNDKGNEEEEGYE